MKLNGRGYPLGAAKLAFIYLFFTILWKIGYNFKKNGENDCYASN